jgi:membrane-bound serine protease (ClpP class)
MGKNSAALAFASLLLAVGGPQASLRADQERPRVLRIDLAGETITPVTARYISASIEKAASEKMTAVVLVLDTPGGLVASTRDAVKSILRSEVPVIVYVAPAGARAASAGVFITMAAHVAAMAPGTTIGAAHPVPVGGVPGFPSPETPKAAPSKPAPRDTADPPAPRPQGPAPDPMEQKIMNDTVAWARALAQFRGRNEEWMAKAVTESVSVTAAEALRERVVDLLADDFDSLLRAIDGREVLVGQTRTQVRTAGASVVTREMWWGEQLLAALANPTLAFLLLIFGIYGVIFELYSPGWGVPGTVGIICLALGFFSLAILPLNYVGLALLLIGLGLLAAEVFVTSYGLLTAGGVLCVVLGALLLVDSPAGFLRVSLWVLVPVAAAISAITAFLVGRAVRAQRLPPAAGGPPAAGSAIAAEDFVAAGNAYQGFVRTHGELWKAVSATPVSAGQTVNLTGRQGLTLHVTVEPPVVPIDKQRRQTA